MASQAPKIVNSWCHTDFDKYEVTYKWTISDFHDRVQYNGFNGSVSLESSPFSLDGKNEKWTLRLDPRLVNQGSGYPARYYLYLYICLKEVENDSQKIWLKYTVTIPPCSGSSAKEITMQSNSYSQVSKGNTAGGHTIEKSTILQKDGYLVDDTLTVYCTLFIKLLDTPKHSTRIVSNVPDVDFSLPSKLNQARQKGTFTDVVLVADGKKSFKAHRAVLALQSSFFNTQFQERWDQGENSVQLSDISPEILECMLTFIYTGQCEIASNAKALLKAAQEYGVESLVQACGQKLSQDINCQNVLSMLIFADTHRALHLKAVCLDFFVLHSSTLMKSSEWQAFEKQREHRDLHLEILDKLVKQKCS